VTSLANSFFIPTCNIGYQTYVPIHSQLLSSYKCFGGENLASAVEIDGKLSAMNSADLIKIGVVSVVVVLQDM
jgi:hypothetical protein